MEEITLTDLIEIFMENIKKIVIVTLLFFVFSIFYTTYLITPMYSASTKIILAYPTENAPTAGLSTAMNSSITLNQKLVSTYSEIIKSKKVVSTVIDELNIGESVESVSNNITVKPVTDSEVINITVENKDSNTAAKIANALIDVFSEEVKVIYGIENINQIDIAEENTEPTNINLLTNFVIFGMLGFILSYGFCFVIKMLKTTVQTEDEIEKIVGKQIIAIIPDIEKGDI